MATKLFCLVFMPFEQSFSFVYAYGIRLAVQDMEKASGLTIDVVRVDEIHESKKEKIVAIKKMIEDADFIISDLTHYRPSVLWEMGYASALGKHIICMIYSAGKKKRDNIIDLPYDIRSLDVIEYDFSVEGMEKFRKDFVKKNLDTINKLRSDNGFLLYEPSVAQMVKTIKDGLSKVPVNSLMRNLAANEIDRVSKRIDELCNGEFELRNEKPNKEIIKYYCDYMSQLEGGAGEFKTVTYCGFWNEITEGGNNSNYFEANIVAANVGAQIKRIFVVSHDYDNEYKLLLKKVLQAFLNEAKKRNDKNIDLKIIDKDKDAFDGTTYENFGLMKKGDERLLFLPHYEKDKMTKTKFFYCSDHNKKNCKNIDKYEKRFDRIEQESVELTQDYIDNIDKV